MLKVEQYNLSEVHVDSIVRGVMMVQVQHFHLKHSVINTDREEEHRFDAFFRTIPLRARQDGGRSSTKMRVW